MAQATNAEDAERMAEYRRTAEEVVAGLGSDQRRGLIPGSGDLPYARTMAFTTLVLFQLFNAPNARSDERSAFHRLFRNPWLRGALVLSLALQILVVYAPFLQPAFGTVSLSLKDWLLCAAVASSVLWLREASKY